MTKTNGAFVSFQFKGQEVFVREAALRARLEQGRVQKKAIGLVMGLVTSGENVWAQFETEYKPDTVTWKKVALAVKDVVEASKAQAEKPATTRIEKLWQKLGLTSAAPTQMESEVNAELKIVRVRWTREFYLANKSRCYSIMSEMRQAASGASLTAWWGDGWLCFQPQGVSAK